ncbi:MAG: hypothetical protein ABIK43_04730 [candidate division WOR-3 bacterium]
MRYLTVILLLLACGSKPEPRAFTPAPQPDTAIRPLTQSPPPPAGQPVSFGRDILPLLSTSCLSCHSPENPGGNYLVNSYCDVVASGSDSTPNVIAGRPESSLLYTYLRQGHPACSPLDSGRLRLIHDWIKQGARND